VPKVNLAHPAGLAYRLRGQSIGGRDSDPRALRSDKRQQRRHDSGRNLTTSRQDRTAGIEVTPYHYPLSVETSAIGRGRVLFRRTARRQRCELHIRPRLVFPQPALGNRVGKRRAVLRGRAAFFEQELAVDLLNVDAPVLYCLGCVGYLQELARPLFRVGERSVSGEFPCASFIPDGVSGVFSAPAPCRSPAARL
jgi:hypothetical protein